MDTRREHDEAQAEIEQLAASYRETLDIQTNAISALEAKLYKAREEARERLESGRRVINDFSELSLALIRKLAKAETKLDKVREWGDAQQPTDVLEWDELVKILAEDSAESAESTNTAATAPSDAGIGPPLSPGRPEPGICMACKFQSDFGTCTLPHTCGRPEPVSKQPSEPLQSIPRSEWPQQQLAYGRPEPTDEELARVARRAWLSDGPAQGWDELTPRGQETWLRTVRALRAKLSTGSVVKAERGVPQQGKCCSSSDDPADHELLLNPGTKVTSESVDYIKAFGIGGVEVVSREAFDALVKRVEAIESTIDWSD